MEKVNKTRNGTAESAGNAPVAHRATPPRLCYISRQPFVASMHDSTVLQGMNL